MPKIEVCNWYLVQDRGGDWHVARPGAVEDPKGEGAPLRLCWCDREGAIIGMAGDDLRAERLPE